MNKKEFREMLKEVAEEFDPTSSPLTFHQWIRGHMPIPKEEWKPKHGENAFWIGNDGSILGSTSWLADDHLIAIGNCYKTKEEAKAALERVKKAYRG